MDRVTWNDSYSIGDDELDGHHQQLIRYIQLLEDREERALRGPAYIQKVVDGLVEYTDYHFRAEEDRMKALDYPELEAHKKLHMDFIKDVSIFKDDFVRASPQLADRLLHYLVDWLMAHILNSDMHFGDYMRSLDDEARGIETGNHERISQG